MLDILLRRVNIGGQLLDVGIAGDTITKVEPHITDSAHKELDGNGQVAILGFADCHLHLDKSLLMERSSYQDVSGPKRCPHRVQRRPLPRRISQPGREGNTNRAESRQSDYPHQCRRGSAGGLAGVRALLGLKKNMPD